MREIHLLRTSTAIGVLLLWHSVGVSSSITESPDAPDGAGIERGVTHLRCRARDGESWFRTRAIILDPGESNVTGEVLLAPAHGLPARQALITRECVVDVGHGSSGEIVDVWLPANRDEAGAGDWAVLTTRKRFRGDINRLRAGMVAARAFTRLVEDHARITLLMHSQAADQDDCRILDPGDWAAGQSDSRVFVHTCRTWPGVSGAPVIAQLDGMAVVIGFNNGRLVRPRRFDGPLYLGVGRIIDAEIAAAIRSAIEHAKP
jgi:hypothetical protein